MGGRVLSFDLQFLKENKYCFINFTQQHIPLLHGVFELIDDAWSDPSPKILRLAKDGYTFYDGPSLPNVLYVSKFKKEHIVSIREFLIQTKIKKKLENLLESNIGVCNIRAYRFTHNPPKEKTHYMDELDESRSFNPHFDGLLPGTLKVMIFKSFNEKNITLEHGALEIKPDSEWISVTGKSPVGIIFPPNIVLHRALQPAKNKIRDAIEITIIKRESNDFLVEYSGAHAGYPKDLKKWNQTKWRHND